MRLDEERIQHTKDYLVNELEEKLGKKLVGVVFFDPTLRYSKKAFRVLVIAEGLPAGEFTREKFEEDLLSGAMQNRVQLWLKTKHELETRFVTEYLDLAVSGDIIYDTGDYLKNKFGRLKKMIVNYQLTRKKVFEGHVWEWRGLSQSFWHIDWDRIYPLKDK